MCVCVCMHILVLGCTHMCACVNMCTYQGAYVNFRGELLIISLSLEHMCPRDKTISPAQPHISSYIFPTALFSRGL